MSEETRLNQQEFTQTQEYRAARLDVLKFQRLVRMLGLQSRWQNFQTLEEGILALMFVPMRSLKLEKLSSLAFGNKQIVASEFVTIQRNWLVKIYGQARIDCAIKKLKENYSRLKWMNHKMTDDIVFVQVIMILNMSQDESIQNSCLDLLSCTINNFCYHLLCLHEHAETSENSPLLRVLAWLTETAEPTIKAFLESNKNPEGIREKLRVVCKMQRKFYSLMTKPGSMDRFFQLTPLSEDLFRAISGAEYFTNYTLWSCAYYFGWQRAWDLTMTIHAHVYILKRANKDLSQLLNKDGIAGYITGPCFINLREMPMIYESIIEATLFENVFDPITHTNATVCEFGDISMDARAPSPEIDYPDLRYCFLDDMIHTDGNLAHTSFKSVSVRNLTWNQMKVFSCLFESVTFEMSRFFSSTFSFCVFKYCHFSSSVSFENSSFSDTASPNFTAFYQCKFNADIFRQIGNIHNARFVNCEFPKDAQLPKQMIRYETEDKDFTTIESLYKFFLLLRKSGDNNMIVQHLLSHKGILWDVLRSYQVSGISNEQDIQFREIVRSQESIFDPLVNFFDCYSNKNQASRYPEEYERTCNKFGIVVRTSDSTLTS